MKWHLTLMFLALCLACGSDDDDSRIPQRQEGPLEGVYQARLDPLNPQYNSFARGFATVTVDANNRGTLQMEVRDVDPSVEHPQFIYTGEACPTLADDANNDGFIDQTEILNRAQEVLTPLNPQSERNYQFQQSLILPAGIPLENRVVMVHGVAGFDVLPDTVGERGELDPEANFPILCGELRRVE